MPKQPRKIDLDRICGVAAAETARALARQVRQALRLTRTVELRLDWLRSDRERSRFLTWLARQRLRGNLIATCRRQVAGGRFHGSVAAERRILGAAVDAGCRWYDVEIESLERNRDFSAIPGAQAIVSLHRFGRPVRDPGRLLRKLQRYPGALGKLAVACDGLRDAVRLIRLARPALSGRSRPEGIITVPMGPVAPAIRLLALREGSPLVYASVDEPVAPGQTRLETTVREYRAGEIGPETRVYGIIGNKVGKSISPAMHNAAFAARGLNAVFLPFLVPDLSDFLEVVAPLGLGGFSVTIPHKQAIVPRLDACDRLAKRLAAVNTVVVRRGRLHGYNTDYAGVLDALRGKVRLEGARVLLVGAGGAARAAAFALGDAGARVSILARRPEQARKLAMASGSVTAAREEIRRQSFDLIVNATPVGMAPDRSAPLAPGELNAPAVFDMVYRPIATPLLRMARARGLRCISGVDMLVAQGVAQWELWTGEKAPARLMKRAALRALRRDAE